MIDYRLYPCISPTTSLSFVGGDCLTPNNLQVPARVFKKTTIYKLYETVVDPVNLDLLHLSLHDTKVENLSVDKRFQCIQYTFCEGQHNPVHKCQFVPLIKSIHKKECVHSDIRSVNLIFSGNGKDAWIIDLTSQSTCYPNNFNHFNILERHPSARANCTREKVHDWYSLGIIMSGSALRLNISEYVVGVKEGNKLDNIV